MGFYQPLIPLIPVSTSLVGQIVVLTGATGGIGQDTALQLLRLGVAKLLIGVRDVSRGKEMRSQLFTDKEVQRANPSVKVEVLPLDLLQFESVKSFANGVMSMTDRLDKLLLNAGINLAEYRASEDGHEWLVQVNFLSNALLALLLLPLLQTASKSNTGGNQRPPTITFVGSMGQAFTNYGSFSEAPSKILEHVSARQMYSRLAQYPNSKMLISLLVREMASAVEHNSDRVLEDGLIVNVVCPGVVDTAADNNLPFYLRIPMNLNRLLRSRSTEEGARTLIYASSLLGRETHGKFISNNMVSSLPDWAETPAGKRFGEQLWAETLAECRRVDRRAGLDL